MQHEEVRISFQKKLKSVEITKEDFELAKNDVRQSFAKLKQSIFTINCHISQRPNNELIMEVTK